MSRDFINYKTIAGPMGGLDLLNYAASEALQFSANGEKDVFPALVLTAGSRMTSAEAEALGIPSKKSAGAAAAGASYKFRASLLDQDRLSRHLPDSCTAKVAATGGSDQKMLDNDTINSMHLQVVMAGGGSGPPQRGSIVYVRLHRGGAANGYDFNLAEFVRFHSKTGNTAAGTNLTTCKDGNYTSQTFDTMPTAPTDPAGGSKDDPTLQKCAARRSSAYPNAPGRANVYSTVDARTAQTLINNTTFSPDVKKMMFVITRQEQGNNSWPSNNPAGILANVGKWPGINSTDIDYQICIHARPSRGDDGWYNYLGFDTPARGIQAFGKIVQYKFDHGQFKALTGSPEKQAEAAVLNYHRGWRMALTTDELQTFAANNPVVRKGEEILKKGEYTKYYNSQLRFLKMYTPPTSTTTSSDPLPQSMPDGTDTTSYETSDV